MITLLTGLPGNGKTLFALWLIKKQSETEQREVYYHNINELTLPWTVFDPHKWMDLPYGAIIVIDEAQDVFSKKPNGSLLPDYYQELAKHRHKGFDIYLITQHPTLLDNFVRQLVGRHFHAIRKFGMARATIYEWSAVNPAPQNSSSHKNAITLKWAYPKEVYGYYKSAEVHTVKRSFPVKIILAIFFIVAVLGVGYYSLTSFQSRAGVKPVPAAGPSDIRLPTRGGAPGGGGGGQAVGSFDALADARHWVDMNTPRIAGLPQTAPKYDDRTKPTHVPVPAACIATSKLCKCYTQQGTAMNVEESMCKGFARDGFFQDFDPDADRVAQARTERSQAVLDASPLSRGRDVSAGPSVAVLAYSEPVTAAPARSGK
jgi:zona occludens toxin